MMLLIYQWLAGAFVLGCCVYTIVLLPIEYVMDNMGSRPDKAPVVAEPVPMCTHCGDRPWGHGYAGELCSVCAIYLQ